MIFVHLPIVSFYTAQTTCLDSMIQAKVIDVRNVYLPLVKVNVYILGIDSLAQ